MINTLRNSAAGINTQQIKMDISANNVANINNTAYKRERPAFADLLYGKMADLGRPVHVPEDAGVPLEGCGSRVAAVERIFEQGALINTGRAMDVAINGDGFFRVQLPDGSYGYTRDGNLKINSDRTLVTSSGYRVYPEITLPEEYVSLEINKDGRIVARDAAGETTEAGNMLIYRFSNNNGLKHLGENMFAETPDSGTAVEAAPGVDGAGEILQESLEMSNVDLAEEMALVIEAQRAYQTGAQSLRTVDQMWNMTNNLRK